MNIENVPSFIKENLDANCMLPTNLIEKLDLAIRFDTRVSEEKADWNLYSYDQLWPYFDKDTWCSDQTMHGGSILVL